MTEKIVKLKDVAKKHDKSIAMVLTAIGTILTIYLSMGDSIDKVVAKCPTIIEIKHDLDTSKQLQIQINSNVDKKLDKIDEKLDRLISRR